MATSPGSLSTSRFSHASSAGALALNLMSKSVCGLREPVTTIYGKETSPCTPCVPSRAMVTVNGPESRPIIINPKPLLQKQFLRCYLLHYRVLILFFDVAILNRIELVLYTFIEMNT